MDVDRDLDANLLQQFSCLGTTDRDVLVSQLQKLLGNQLNAAGCAFFLDMNNWNLQAAVCSYFDYDSPKDDLPNMSFVKDVTIGEGEEIPPNTKFLKTWKIQNPGEEVWPPGCCLRFTSGDQMGHIDRVYVNALKAHEMADVSVEMVSPQAPGIYQGQWRMATATGQFFGEVIWVIVTVAEGGLLGLTQQMDAFHQLGSPPRTSHVGVNPFAAPTGKFGGPIPAHLQNGDSAHPSMLIDNSHSHQNSLPSSPLRNHQTQENQFLFNPGIIQDLPKSEPSTEEMIP